MPSTLPPKLDAFPVNFFGPSDGTFMICLLLLLILCWKASQLSDFDRKHRFISQKSFNILTRSKLNHLIRHILTSCFFGFAILTSAYYSLLSFPSKAVAGYLTSFLNIFLFKWPQRPGMSISQKPSNLDSTVSIYAHTLLLSLAYVFG